MSLSAATVVKFESPTRTLLTVRPNTSKFSAIYFDRVGKAGQGIRMAAPANTPIAAPTDVVPVGYTHQKVVLKLAWPGYTTESKVVISTGKASRLQLANAIILHFSKFVAEVARKEGSKGKLPLHSAFHAQLVLIGIHHIADDVWQADIAHDTQVGLWV
ncbi:hypothetical protein BKA70DRAFT_1494742 [Coprinopsis sp. MPI-PUGE-AT-0042]|nr:hypothetical protein BKA70DRAFT_1494742 [Coprinopsis sp. MPI-PUGE-AT-0042]